jgi:hypothetical protein
MGNPLRPRLLSPLRFSLRIQVDKAEKRGCVHQTLCLARMANLNETPRLGQLAAA